MADDTEHEERDPADEAFDAELLDPETFEKHVAVYTSDTALVEAVKRIVQQERAHRSADCVDEQILAELERAWNRLDPTNVFGLYESIKAENPDAWVSPEVSLRMFVSVEHLARTSLNEATRGV
jgi:hypothetical protein